MPFMDVFKNLDPRDLENAAPVTHGADYATPSKAKGAYMATITRLKDIVIRNFSQTGKSLNASIADLTTQEGLNHDQVKRLIEEVNCDVYLDEYVKSKNNSVRDVSFEIATITKVKDLMNPADSQDLEETQKDSNGKIQNGGNKGMMKKAFEENFEGDSLNAFNYTAYESCGLAPDADKDIDPSIFKIRKMAKMIAELDADIEKTARDLYENHSALANALIKIAQTSTEAQSKFATICKTAQMSTQSQTALIDLFNEKVANYKELGYIAPSANITIDKVEDLTPETDFSLGEHSLLKSATEATPVVVTNKGVVKDLNNLVALATKIEQGQKSLQTKQDKKNSINSKIK